MTAYNKKGVSILYPPVLICAVLFLGSCSISLQFGGIALFGKDALGHYRVYQGSRSSGGHFVEVTETKYRTCQVANCVFFGFIFAGLTYMARSKFARNMKDENNT